MRNKAALALFLAWCLAAPVSANTSDPSLQHVVESKILRVGIAMNAPWVIRKPDGTLAGYDIDLVNAIATDLGATPQFVEMPFSDLVGRLAHGDVDMVASGLAITPARALEVVFSNPTGLAIVRTVASLDNKQTTLGADTKIAVLAHSTDEAAARVAYPAATIVAYPNASDAMAAVINGNAQAMVATSPVPRLAAKLFDARLKLVGPPLTKTAEAFAFKPDDRRLQQYVDNWIEARKADGFIDNVRRYWFYGFDWIHDLEPATGGDPK